MEYFDFAASCPLDSEAAKVYVKIATEYFGNPSSLHEIGSQANDLLEQSRMAMANLLGVRKEGVYFTSGGAEGNFLAIYTLLSSPLKIGRHIITGVAEHSSIHSTMAKLQSEGYEVTTIPLDETGHISIDQVQQMIRDDTILMSIQHGNSEIGTVQPLSELADLCRENNILLHSDCVQTFGKIDIRPIAEKVDSLTISGHKFYGPKGTGVVYMNPERHWESYVPFTTHESGFRPGTVNVPGIVAMTVAAEKAVSEMASKDYKQLADMFIKTIEPAKTDIIIYPSDLHSIIGLRLKGIEGQFVMLECNAHGFAISTGSACQATMQTPSNTMTALGITGKSAKEFIRISFGRKTTIAAVEQLGKTLLTIMQTAKRS